MTILVHLVLGLSFFFQSSFHEWKLPAFFPQSQAAVDVQKHFIRPTLSSCFQKWQECLLKKISANLPHSFIFEDKAFQVFSAFDQCSFVISFFDFDDNSDRGPPNQPSFV